MIGKIGRALQDGGGPPTPFGYGATGGGGCFRSRPVGLPLRFRFLRAGRLKKVKMAAFPPDHTALRASKQREANRVLPKHTFLQTNPSLSKPVWKFLKNKAKTNPFLMVASFHCVSLRKMLLVNLLGWQI